LQKFAKNSLESIGIQK